MNGNQREQLIVTARDARQQAYAPYSGFEVGAAVLTKSGEIFSGCNIENASYGLTICAERVAMVTAVAAGYRDFAAIAVVTSGGASPCGSCRQFLAEFCDDVPILLVNADDATVEETQLTDLLPRRFSASRTDT
ncbi:MAG: cytidine deaminase [Planctomycetes bacterium]|nr:cytidine deaminase [Planctomycetota bacterium]